MLFGLEGFIERQNIHNSLIMYKQLIELIRRGKNYMKYSATPIYPGDMAS